MVMPGLFIFLATVLFEKGENMRFKFFLEPVYYIFLASQFLVLCRYVWRTVMVKKT